jgi:hypothetical protein
VFLTSNHQSFINRRIKSLADLPRYPLPPTTRTELGAIASHISNTLDRHGIAHWLDFGSLLGAVRNQSIIPWDFDGKWPLGMRSASALFLDVVVAGEHRGSSLSRSSDLHNYNR